MRRGDIYFVEYRGNSLGHETQKSRPGVIVSADALNHTSGVVEVVYMTTRPKKDLPTHVLVQATGKESTVCCEQIDSISTQRLGRYCGHCSDDEMAAIEAALLASLGLRATDATTYEAENDSTLDELAAELEAVRAERDRYAKMVDLLMEVAEA